MKPEKLLLLEPGKSQVDMVLQDEMGQLWAHLVTLSEKAGAPWKKVGIVSSASREGSTTTAIALARYLVYGLQKTACLVEANLRRPVLGRLLPRLKKGPGFREILEGTAQVEETIYHLDSRGLSVIPAGREDSPAGYPSGEGLAKALDRLCELHDAVILDCPPLGMAAESHYLLKGVDAAVLVVQARRTHLETVSQSIKTIRHLEKPLGGVVMNDVVHALPGALRALF